MAAADTTTRAPNADALADRVRRVSFVVVLILGALDAWFFRDWNVNPDGVSYIDLGRAVAAHGPLAALNGYWSPLFPVVIGALLKLVRPSPELLYPLVRGLTFLTFAGTTMAFDRLVRLACTHSPAYQSARPWVRGVAIVVFWEAYALYVLKAVGLGLVTPDMGVTLVVCWACGALVQLSAARRTARWWVLLGTVLAAGYWWKAILFPVGGVILLVAFAIAWRRRDGVRGPVWAAVTFGVLALTLIVPVSRLAGRPTFSETGRLNQLWYSNSAPYVWTLCLDGNGSLPLARAKAVRTDSVVARVPLTCALPDRWPEATLPMWYDPSWWYRDTHAYVDVRETMGAVRNDLGYLREAIASAAPVFTVGVLVVAAAALVTWSSMGTAWPLLLVAAIAAMFYLLVYVELRHVAPFLVTSVIAVSLALLSRSGRWRTGLLVALACAGLVDVERYVSEPMLIELSILRHEVRGDPRPQQVSARVARLLAARGLQPGDRVATVNTLWNADWAQRGGFVVRAYVSEITVSYAQTFRELRDPCVRAAWTAALGRARIEAVVLLAPAGLRAPDDFEPLGDTGYYLLRIGRTVAPAGCHAG